MASTRIVVHIAAIRAMSYKQLQASDGELNQSLSRFHQSSKTIHCCQITHAVFLEWDDPWYFWTSRDLWWAKKGCIREVQRLYRILEKDTFLLYLSEVMIYTAVGMHPCALAGKQRCCVVVTTKLRHQVNGPLSIHLYTVNDHRDMTFAHYSGM